VTASSVGTDDDRRRSRDDGTAWLRRRRLAEALEAWVPIYAGAALVIYGVIYLLVQAGGGSGGGGCTTGRRATRSVTAPG
jgi:hypothetical protein